MRSTNRTTETTLSRFPGSGSPALDKQLPGSGGGRDVSLEADMGTDLNCYYHNDSCDTGSRYWQCWTCREFFCSHHQHLTTLGRNVECVSCERIRNGQPVSNPEPHFTISAPRLSGRLSK